MADRQRGMGRGLAAILSVNPAAEDEELRELPVELVDPSPHQPRRSFDGDELVALADSIRQRGVLQPILVRPRPGGRYELVAGERRWRAATLAELSTVPAIVRHRDDAASVEIALIENMARSDLSPVEEARACAALVEELGLTREEVGLRVARSRVAVSNLIRLLDLPDEALGLLDQGLLSEGHGRALLLAEDHGERRRLARLAASERWSVRETEARARAVHGALSPGRGGGEGRGSRARRGGAEPEPHADQQAAAERIAEVLSAPLGLEVKVIARGQGFRVELELASTQEAAELARRLGAPRADELSDGL